MVSGRGGRPGSTVLTAPRSRTPPPMQASVLRPRTPSPHAPPPPPSAPAVSPRLLCGAGGCLGRAATEDPERGLLSRACPPAPTPWSRSVWGPCCGLHPEHRPPRPVPRCGPRLASSCSRCAVRPASGKPISLASAWSGVSKASRGDAAHGSPRHPRSARPLCGLSLQGAPLLPGLAAHPLSPTLLLTSLRLPCPGRLAPRCHPPVPQQNSGGEQPACCSRLEPGGHLSSGSQRPLPAPATTGQSCRLVRCRHHRDQRLPPNTALLMRESLALSREVRGGPHAPADTRRQHLPRSPRPARRVAPRLFTGFHSH